MADNSPAILPTYVLPDVFHCKKADFSTLGRCGVIFPDGSFHAFPGLKIEIWGTRSFLVSRTGPPARMKHSSPRSKSDLMQF
jgi:hypothetical protein